MGQNRSRNRKKSAGATASASLVNLPFNRKGINFKNCQQFLDRHRNKKLTGTVEKQKFSLVETHDFQFPESKISAIDLCVLGSVPKISALMEKVRKECMDEAFVLKHHDNWTTVGVFDGHGSLGKEIAKMVLVRAVDLLLSRQLKIARDQKPLKDPIGWDANKINTVPRDYFEKLFKNLHDTLLQSSDASACEAGTTATLVSMKGKKLHVSWVGDSKAVLFIGCDEGFSNLIPFNITTEHNFDLPEERARINSAGTVHRSGADKRGGGYGPLRVFKKAQHKPGLNLSRSIGDEAAAELGVSHVPDYLEIDLAKVSTLGDLEKMIPSKFNMKIAKSKSQKQKKLVMEVAASDHSMAKLGKNTMRLADSANNSFLITTDMDSFKELDEAVAKVGKLGQLSSSNLDLTDCSFTKIDDSVSESELIIPEPAPKPMSKTPVKHAILVVASDGVWDNITPEKLGVFIGIILEKQKSLTEKGASIDVSDRISKQICLKAQRIARKGLYNGGSCTDDITAVTAVLF